MTDRERLTHGELGRATRELAQQICDSGFAPDIVLSIARGGFLGENSVLVWVTVAGMKGVKRS